MRDLKQIADDMLTQDNRGTASPMLILLQVKKEFVAHDEFQDFDAEEIFVECASGDYTRFSTYEELLEWWNEDLMPADQLKELVEGKHYNHNFMNYYWETENVFFSDKGYEEHMALNSHNYRKGKVRSYGIHAFRNAELKTVMDELLKINR